MAEDGVDQHGSRVGPPSPRASWRALSIPILARRRSHFRKRAAPSRDAMMPAAAGAPIRPCARCVAHFAGGTRRGFARLAGADDRGELTGNGADGRRG
jgi:hypothetical protein